MNIPENWLKSFVNYKLDIGKLAHLLTMSGLEVESCAPVAPPFSGVVVGEILAVERHPHADKLTVCTVNTGQDRRQVVCGAPNVRAGMKVPLATVGAVLGSLEIKNTKLRGVDSQGMLCSARELGLSDDHAGLLELAADATPGQDLYQALALDEQVLTLKLTPNRADCLSVLGIAREVAALSGEKLIPCEIKPVAEKSPAQHPFKITDAEGCGRFAGRVIRNVNAAATTPVWMRQRLERAGQRSIAALVDVTNYVMLELGRPLHVYDQDKLKGAIDVRWGRQGEKLLLLNGQEVEVDPGVLCITDDSGPIGLAGIMGGESTKAGSDTQNIFLESAFFFPEAIAGRARRYNFTSDAAHRFERGVDFDNNVEGIERATQLILEICGGEPGPTVDRVERLPARKPVRMRVARAKKILGIAIDASGIEAVFRRLAFAYQKDQDSFIVKPPTYRFDLEIEEDLIEEVARVHGFDNIPAHPPHALAKMRASAETQRSLHALRERVAACDYQETINFAFVESAWEADLAGVTNPVRLLNPIASQAGVMRSTLFGSLIANLRTNHARKLGRIRVFEIARVYLRDIAAVDGPLSVAGLRQPLRVAGAAYGQALDEQWGNPSRAVDFFDVKADLEAICAPRRLRFEAAAHPALHPGRSARVSIDGNAGDEPVGWLGELHPRWQQKYELPQPVVLFELEAERLAEVPLPRLTRPSRFPPVVRDIALLVDAGLSAQAFLDAVQAERPAIVQEVKVFDLYQGQNLPAGRKSLAFRVVMQDTERTLTDGEADAARDALVELWGRSLGAKVRA
ncbi:MAG: phenylalanine--tRNA ligase subunit beta [Betaproteobacteria bacterium]|nr:phenylalanine--tRNA ligase subunit beta [Betaproteobacteria bacterium]